MKEGREGGEEDGRKLVIHKLRKPQLKAKHSTWSQEVSQQTPAMIM